MLLRHNTAPGQSTFAGRPAQFAGMPVLAQPPFWELERLIAAGCDRMEALTVICARRNRAERHPAALDRHLPRMPADTQRTERRRRIP